jgi:hypothetical protein
MVRGLWGGVEEFCIPPGAKQDICPQQFFTSPVGSAPNNMEYRLPSGPWAGMTLAQDNSELSHLLGKNHRSAENKPFV